VDQSVEKHSIDGTLLVIIKTKMERSFVEMEGKHFIIERILAEGEKRKEKNE